MDVYFPLVCQDSYPLCHVLFNKAEQFVMVPLVFRALHDQEAFTAFATIPIKNPLAHNTSRVVVFSFPKLGFINLNYMAWTPDFIDRPIIENILRNTLSNIFVDEPHSLIVHGEILAASTRRSTGDVGHR